MNKKNINKGGGVLSGLLLLIIGIGLLWYNEGRTVKTLNTINEAKKNYTDVSSATVDSKYEGKLIATKGKIDINNVSLLTDTKFGINVKAAKLKRVVEMYQWKESCETDEDDKTTCTYEQVWEDSLIDSSDFKEPGHTNPTTMPYASEEYIADNVKLGAYILPEELIKKLSCNRKKDNTELTQEYNKSVEGLNVVDNYITNVKDNNAAIGNIRISYEYLDSETVSVMAVQDGNSFVAFTSKTGKDVYKIMKGNYTGAQILEGMVKSNNNLKWILRIIGILLVIGAFNSMFAFINNIAGLVPILGNIVQGATGLIATLLGLAVSLLVIAIAWFRFRPILSLVLILVAVFIVFFLRMKKSNVKVEDKK